MTKTWSTTSNLAALSLGALLSACGAAGSETSVDSDQAGLARVQLGEAAEALTVCDDNQYDYRRHLSALAIAAGMELGRWYIGDFTWNNGVQLSASGLARCKNGCANIQAILSLQNNGGGIIPRHDPLLLKQYMQSFYNDQVNYTNNFGWIEHELVPTTVTTASCGFRYWFRDTLPKLTGTTPLKAAFSNKCVDISINANGTYSTLKQMACSGATRQSFALDPIFAGGYRLKNGQEGRCMRVPGSGAGTVLDEIPCDTTTPSLKFDVLDLGAGKYQLKSRDTKLCVEVAGSSTADGAQIRTATCNAAATNQQFLANLQLVKFDNPNQPAMAEFLRFAGGTSNPFLQFQYNAQEVSVDPMGTMVDGGSSGQTGSCIEASSAFDTTRQVAGKCCSYSGKYGTFVATAWNANLFYCK